MNCIFKIDNNLIKVDSELVWFELTKCFYGSLLKQISDNNIEQFQILNYIVSEWDPLSETGWVLIPFEVKDQTIKIELPFWV